MSEYGGLVELLQEKNRSTGRRSRPSVTLFTTNHTTNLGLSPDYLLQEEGDFSHEAFRG